MSTDPRHDMTVAILVGHRQVDLLACQCGWGPPQRSALMLADHQAEHVLIGLSDMGALVEPDSETRVEWAYQVAGHAEPWGQTRYRHRAEERLSTYLEQMPGGQAYLVRRNVYTGPWEAVDTLPKVPADISSEKGTQP